MSKIKIVVTSTDIPGLDLCYQEKGPGVDRHARTLCVVSFTGTVNIETLLKQNEKLDLDTEVDLDRMDVPNGSKFAITCNGDSSGLGSAASNLTVASRAGLQYQISKRSDSCLPELVACILLYRNYIHNLPSSGFMEEPVRSLGGCFDSSKLGQEARSFSARERYCFVTSVATDSDQYVDVNLEFAKDKLSIRRQQFGEDNHYYHLAGTPVQ